MEILICNHFWESHITGFVTLHYFLAKPWKNLVVAPVHSVLISGYSMTVMNSTFVS